MLANVKGETKACQKLLEMGSKIVVLKQGKEGCTVFSENNSDGIKINGFKAEEVDPTGAGDSFGGAFVVGYLNGWDLKEIARFANSVGALKVEHFGPMPSSSYEDVKKILE